MPLSSPPTAPPAKRGTALIGGGVLLSLTTAHNVVYGQWLTYLLLILGLLICYTGVYINIRKPRA